MSARSLVVHKAVHPYRVAALNRWRAIVEAAARGESVSAEQERALYEAEMDAHDTMLSALAAPMSATPEGVESVEAFAQRMANASRHPSPMRDLLLHELPQFIAAHVAARVGEELRISDDTRHALEVAVALLHVQSMRGDLAPDEQMALRHKAEEISGLLRRLTPEAL
jgi:hypothetical protein